MSKTINIRARTGITALPVYDRITVTDSNAYHLIVEMADLESIPGQVILRFVRADEVTIEQMVDPANVVGNLIYHTLSEQQTAVAGALQMYVRITDGVSELYTAALIIFTNVVPLAGGDTTPTEEDLGLVASIAAAEAARAYWAEFDPLRQYAVGEKVYYEPTGSSYICTVAPPIGTLPTDTSYWSIVVQKGDVQFASFEVDSAGDLIMTTTPDYAGPTFALSSTGDLEVTV